MKYQIKKNHLVKRKNNELKELKRSLDNLWQSYTSPKSKDIEKAQQEYITKIILLIFVFTSLGALIIMPFFGVYSLTIVISWIFFISSILAVYLAQKGNFILPRYFLPILMYILTIWEAYLLGPNNVILMLVIIDILITIFLFEKKWQLTILALSIIGTYAVTLSSIRDDTLYSIFSSVSFLFLVGLLLYFYTKQFRIDFKNLLIEKENLNSIITALGNALVVTDENRHITMVNNAFENLTGWKAKEALGQDLLSIVPIYNSNQKKLSYEEASKVIDQLFKKNTSSKTILKLKDYYYIRKEDGLFPIKATLTPVISNNKTIGIVQIFKDVSDDVETEQNRNIFLSLATQHFQPPLKAIQNHASLLKKSCKEKSSPIEKEYINAIILSTKRIAELIEYLEDFAKIEEQQVTTNNIALDINTVIDSNIEKNIVRLKNKNLELSKNLDKNIKEIYLDEKSLSTVLNNLISNAVRYTSEGGKIEISTEKKKKGKENTILIAIKDTGYGIPKEEQSHIFEKSFRASNIKSIENSGTGLGLYISKSIIEKMNGKIYFESELNKGTTFFIELPLKTQI